MDTTQRSERRRRYTLEFKRQVVEETLAGGGSVSVVARRHDLNANLLFNWRKRYQKGTLNGARDTPPALVPIRVAAPCQEAPVTGRGSEVAALELMLASGHRVWIHGAIDPGDGACSAARPRWRPCQPATATCSRPCERDLRVSVAAGVGVEPCDNWLLTPDCVAAMLHHDALARFRSPAGMGSNASICSTEVA